HGDKHAALGPRLANVAALVVAGEYDQRIGVQDLLFVDVAQGPVVVLLGAQAVDGAGSVVVVSLAAGGAGVQHADIQVARPGRRVGLRQVLGDGGSGEALAVDRHAALLKDEGVGPVGRQLPDVVRQAQVPGHPVGGVVIAGGQEDRDLR